MRKLYHLTPDIEADLRRLYAEPYGVRHRTLGHLARRHGLPKWRVARWAVELGLTRRDAKARPWTPEEDALLERNGHLGLGTLVRRFRAAGFARSPNAIKIRLQRAPLERHRDAYSAREVAAGFGVDAKTVTRWIHTGLLRARRRGTLRLAAQGGDEFLVTDADLVHFVRKNPAAFDLRKVEQAWFLSLLVGVKTESDQEDVA